MKKALNDEMLPNYDFASMKGGVRGKYVGPLRKSTNIVVLEPEVAKAFPNEASVNEALRGLLGAARTRQRTRKLSAKPVRTSRRKKKTGTRD